MMRRAVHLAVSAVLALSATGCASLHARKEREEQLQRQLDLVRYHQPLEEVWQEARRLLADQDYPLAGQDAAAVGQQEQSLAERLVSPARETAPGEPEQVGILQRLTGPNAQKRSGAVQSLDTGWNKYQERYHLVARQDDAGCWVVFTRLRRTGPDRDVATSRDTEQELALLRRLDPEAAARLEAGAPADGG